MSRRQPSGMGTKRGKPVQRPPVVLPTCRGCDAPPSLETLLFTDRGVVCGACGIDDPCGLFGPMRPVPSDEPRP